MSMGDDHSIYMPQTIFGEPFNSRCLEILPHIAYYSAVQTKSLLNSQGPSYMRREKTHVFRPDVLVMRNTAPVFLRIFFFPSGVKVDKHVSQRGRFGGAVRQSR